VIRIIRLNASSELELGRFFLTRSFSFRFLTKEKEEKGQRQLNKKRKNDNAVSGSGAELANSRDLVDGDAAIP
jgi:hypothetical protein